MKDNILMYLGLGAMNFAPFAPFVGFLMFFQSGASSGIAAGVTAAVIGLAGSALHVWYNNRKLSTTTGLERDKQIDARTVRLFDQMEEHYKEMLGDKNSTIKTYRDIVKQKDNLLEGYRSLNAAQVVANQMPPVAEPAPTV